MKVKRKPTTLSTPTPPRIFNDFSRLGCVLPNYIEFRRFLTQYFLLTSLISLEEKCPSLTHFLRFLSLPYLSFSISLFLQPLERRASIQPREIESHLPILNYLKTLKRGIHAALLSAIRIKARKNNNI